LCAWAERQVCAKVVRKSESRHKRFLHEEVSSMNAKRICAILMVVCLAVPVVATAQLPAPTNLNVAPGIEALLFDWDDVAGAVKYSLDIEALVTYYDEVAMTEVTVEVTLSFGTSDRTDGGLMGDSDLTVPIDDIVTALLDQLGVDLEDIISVEDAIAKVKALAPGKGQGAQNNPFSDPVVLIP
jgi:hypothetical protein